jgi:hypothetical protein
MGPLRRLFLHSPKKYAVALAAAVAVTAAGLRFRGAALLIQWADAVSTAGALVLLLGLLGLVERLGAFDTVGYGLSNLRQKRWRDLYEYSEAKREKRSRAPLGFMAFVTVGAAFLIAGLVMMRFV